MPFVLRPEAHFWRIVGHAFVEDAMEVSDDMPSCDICNLTLTCLPRGTSHAESARSARGY